MDVRYNHGTNIYVLRTCTHDDACDLLAIGGDHSVDVLFLTGSTLQPLASFNVGARITALAWSSRTTSPSFTDNWFIELTAAGADFGLHLLTKSSSDGEEIFPFGGGLSGHHGKVNDMAFCGGQGQDSTRYVATVSDDKMLMVWDLQPKLDISSSLPSPARSPATSATPPPATRPQPTAYVIALLHPLTTISSHPATSKEFLVSDCRGSIFLVDWRSDPDEGDRTSWRNSSVVELVEPHSLSNSAVGLSPLWSGSVAWRKDTVDIIGAVYGSKFSIWDISNLRGGKPFAVGNSFSEGGSIFRWCPTYPEYFAIATQSPIKGAVIHIHNTSYVHSQPTVFNLRPRPHFVRDLDFLTLPEIPRIAAAVGQTVIIFPIGVDS